jgi:hypothetical protein
LDLFAKVDDVALQEVNGVDPEGGASGVDPNGGARSVDVYEIPVDHE